ncbi:MAG: ureidoglycolate lyase [Rubrivivax sp.]|nr:ureidoglycolate lyase [Rubrivivax sp.]
MPHRAPQPRIVLRPQPLSAASFEPYGQLIEANPEAPHHTINDGHAERFHDLARVDTAEAGGRTLVNIFRARPRALPLRLSLVERHRLGSQLFMPLSSQRFIVVVAAAGRAPEPDALRCFLAGAGQGVNLSRGVWHHPLLALDAGGDFLVIDRGSPGPVEDCEVRRLNETEVWIET